MASIADVLTSSVVELGSLLQAVDVDTDKPDSPQQVDLIAFVGQQASQISHESSKVSAVMMVAPTLDSCKFVSQSLLQPVIALVSASQLLCRYCGNTRKAELRGLVKCVSV